MVYLLLVRRSSSRRREHQPRWNIFTSPSVNQEEKLITGTGVEREKERGGEGGMGGGDVVDVTPIEAMTTAAVTVMEIVEG